VKVLRVDEATDKISLGLKQLQDDPWTTLAAAYAVGERRAGRVTRVADFGVFVELEPGIEGLAHMSTFAPTAGGWSKSSVPVGTTGTFQITSIDTAQRRIGLALVEEGATDTGPTEAADAPATASHTGPIGSMADQLRDALERK
jgi:small subunit ribosomal protein S1